MHYMLGKFSFELVKNLKMKSTRDDSRETERYQQALVFLFSLNLKKIRTMLLEDS